MQFHLGMDLPPENWASMIMSAPAGERVKAFEVLEQLFRSAEEQALARGDVAQPILKEIQEDLDDIAKNLRKLLLLASTRKPSDS